MMRLYIVKNQINAQEYLVSAPTPALARRLVAEQVLMRLECQAAKPMDVLRLIRDGAIPMSTEPMDFLTETQSKSINADADLVPDSSEEVAQ